jgi:hypothetical protein
MTIIDISDDNDGAITVDEALAASGFTTEQADLGAQEIIVPQRDDEVIAYHANVRADADEIAHRLGESTIRLTYLRQQKQALFDMIREEVERHGRLVRAARIYGITANDDTGDQSGF